MVFGMSIPVFTLVHVLISMVALLFGVVVLIGMLCSRRFTGATAVFLVTTVLTSVTGFLFPFEKLLPSHIVGAVSLVVLAVAGTALYVNNLRGRWRWIYVSAALTAFYLNAFVGIAQSFRRFSVLSALAPTQTEPPFWAAQSILLIIFIVLGVQAAKLFRPEATPTMMATASSEGARA